MARPGLRNNPKFKRLMGLMGEPYPHVRGYLEVMWEVGYECGDDRLGDPEDVELCAEFPGEKGKLFKALLDSRLIDEREGSFHIHDLWDHAPEYVKRRHQREQERRNKGLQQKMSDTGRQVRTRGTSLDGNGATPAPAPAPIGGPAIAGTAQDRPPPRKQDTASGPHVEFRQHFTELWHRKFGRKYGFQAGKDGSAVGRILKACEENLAEAKRIASDFIADEDPWISSTGHTIAVLSSQINRYLAGAHKPTSAESDNGFVRATITDDLRAAGLGREP